MTPQERITFLLKAKRILTTKSEELTSIDVTLAHDYVNMVIDDIIFEESKKIIAMTFETFKQQLKPEDFMLNNLMATMQKCFEAGQEDAATSYKHAISEATKKHPELNIKPEIFLCHVYAKRSKDLRQ